MGGSLSSLVLSIIPLIQPFRWQSLLMQVLPTDMRDFLDAPVPYIVENAHIIRMTLEESSQQPPLNMLLIMLIIITYTLVRMRLEGPRLTMSQKIWYYLATVGGQ